MGEEDIYKLDRTIGFMHFPNKRVTWRSEGFSQSYFDADGMRDPGLTVTKPAGVVRVALLGDSMVEGLQVPIEQTFGKLIEKKLNAEGKHHVQVLNFANSGYSTAQEYLELKSKVFKYQPDIVVLSYMSRDMFENWSPADQTITNVRPYALHLPGKQLVVDSSPVEKWMRTPRAKFLMRIEWLRHYSRIWGLISATETQLSLQDPTYKAITAFLTNPAKATREIWKQIRHTIEHPPSLEQLSAMASPSFNINFFEGNNNTHKEELVQSSITHAPRMIPKVRFVTEPQLSLSQAANREKCLDKADSVHLAKRLLPGSAAILAAVSRFDSMSMPAGSRRSQNEFAEPSTRHTNKSDAVDPAKAQAGNKSYVDLMKRTMDSLIASMKEQCSEHAAELCVFAVPCRAQLSPTAGMETSFFNISYNDEVTIINDICQREHVPVFNGEAAAESLPAKERPAMFYLMHLNAKGHEFIADKLYPFLSERVQNHDR
jgi:hypothetical protein